MKLDNPFLIRGYAGPEYFCDRAAETQKLVSAISNGRDVTLVAPRSDAPDGLIEHIIFSHSLPLFYKSAHRIEYREHGDSDVRYYGEPHIGKAEDAEYHNRRLDT